MKNYSIMLMLLLLAAYSVYGKEYFAKESGDDFELATPWGTKKLLGDSGLGKKKRYHIEIPIESLKPKEVEKPASPKEEKEAVPPQQKESLSANQPHPSEPAPRDLTASNTPAPTLTSSPTQEISQPKLKIEYDDTDKLVLEANHLFNQGRYFEASENVEELVRKNPTYLRGWIMKGSLMYVQNQKDLAIKAWEKARSLEPENEQIKILLERYK